MSPCVVLWRVYVIVEKEILKLVPYAGICYLPPTQCSADCVSLDVLLVGCKDGLLMGSACVAYQVRSNSGGSERRVPTEDPSLRFWSLGNASSIFQSLRTLNTLCINTLLSLILQHVCMSTSMNVMCLCHRAHEEVRGQHCTWVLDFSCLLDSILLLVTVYAKLCRPKLPEILCPSPVSS